MKFGDLLTVYKLTILWDLFVSITWEYFMMGSFVEVLLRELYTIVISRKYSLCKLVYLTLVCYILIFNDGVLY